MDIGEPKPAIVVEPLEDPFEQPAPAPEPEKLPVPEREPEKVPA